MEIIPRILIYWYITIFISSEILSYFNLINRPLIILVHTLFLVAVLFFNKQTILFLLKNLLHKQDIFIYIIALILGLTFLQGAFSAPNTTDSMVYHLPKVMYWIQEHTLYQDVIRNDHDFMAPFAEYILLHLYLIFDGDRMLFFSQWLAFVTSIVLSYLIAKKIGVEEKVAQLTAVFVATLPIGVLQATSTQTDMVTTMLVLLSVHFALVFKKLPSFTNSLLLGFIIGLGILTKATFVLYAFIPIILVLDFFLKKRQRFLFPGLIIFLVVLVVQARFVDQNLRIYGNLTGLKLTEKGGGYVNELIDGRVILSNLARNLFLHLPLPFFTQEVQNLIAALHSQMGLELNDPRTTYYDTKFFIFPVVFPQEDIAGNPVQLLLIFLAGSFLIFRVNNFKKIDLKTYLYILTLLSFVIFSAILKWQPFHSRLQIPFFILGAIVSVGILVNHRYLKIFLNVVLIFSVAFGFVILILNTSRPFISYTLLYPYVKNFAPPLSDIPQFFITRERDKQYFSARNYWFKPYNEIVKKLNDKQINLKEITFNLMDGFEYPLWVLMNKYQIDLKIVPRSKASREVVILSTSETPLQMEGYNVECVKTEIEYGYACIARKYE